MADTKVFLLDEPLSNLDARMRAEMRAEIAQLHRRLGTTMIFVTHDLSVASGFCHRVIVLDKGRIVEEGRGERGGQDQSAEESNEPAV